MSDCSNVQKVFVPVKETKEGQPAPSAPRPFTGGFLITDTAAEKIKHFCQVDGKSAEEFGLKIGVVKDGCSGNSYTMNLTSIQECREKGDKVFVKNGATVIIEKLSYMFLIGSQLDYVETLLMSGFQIGNPNVKASCSCGSSFAV